MKTFKPVISLVKNSRGCWILDTVKGCSVCEAEKPGGCYGDCYAKRIASRYGIDFNNPIKRDFTTDKQYALFDFANSEHEKEILNTILHIDMPFVRIGDMGDPSEDWFHTFKVCSIAAKAGKPIIIITKHWHTILDEFLAFLGDAGICINTSISALDSPVEITHRLSQYKRLSEYCHSVLRVVTCDFNQETQQGIDKLRIQDELLANRNVIDTVFRPSIDNPLVTSGLVLVKKMKFMNSKVWASAHDDSIYMGKCDTCPDMCGINRRTN